VKLVLRNLHVAPREIKRGGRAAGRKDPHQHVVLVLSLLTTSVNVDVDHKGPLVAPFCKVLTHDENSSKPSSLDRKDGWKPWEYVKSIKIIAWVRKCDISTSSLFT
jgi:hypothetical protein